MDYALIGLGNPGEKYANTRHNIGFLVMDELAARHQFQPAQMKYKGVLVQVMFGDLRVALVKPLTFMNLSGECVLELSKAKGLSSDRLVIVSDDFALPLGTLRFRERGSDGGHNGLKSVIARLGTQDFPRLRLGVGKPEHAHMDHVLGKFSPDEMPAVRKTVVKAADALEFALKEGIQKAASRFNGPLEEPERKASEPSGASMSNPMKRSV